MSHLDQRVTVTCPLAQAAMRLRDFFRETRNSAAETAKLTIGLDVDISGRLAPLRLQQEIVATIQSHHLPADMTPRYRVVWAPQTPGWLPLFEGELVVDGNSDFDSFGLRLSGSYTPPFGLFGKGFDVAVGNRVAEATAKDLLERIKHSIEGAFANDEARKPLAART